MNNIRVLSSSIFIAAILFLACNKQITYAQTKSKTHCGFTMDAYYMSEQQNSKSTNQFFASPLFHLFAGYEINKYFQADLNAGYLVFASEWDGPVIGFTLKYKPINKFFISAGWNYNHIIGSNDLSGNLPPVFYSRDFNFINAGGGYFLTKILFVQLIFSKPLNKDTIYGKSSQAYPGEQVTFFKLQSKLSLDFGFNFSI